jgi:hypothetical protein
MAEDNRGSRKPTSGTVDVPSGDSSNFDVIDLRAEATMALQEINVDYDSSATSGVTVEIYDEPEAVTTGNESDLVDKLRLGAGEVREPDMTYRDIEDGVLVTTGGGQDAALTVTVGGYIISG